MFDAPNEGHILKVYKKIKWLRRKFESSPSSIRDSESLQRIIDYSLTVVYPRWYEGLMRQASSLSQKEKKLRRQTRKFIEEMLLAFPGKCYFCTFTIDNQSRDNISLDTLRRYLKDHLTEYASCYICNLDFAPKTNRPHFHGVVAFESEAPSWKYGFCLYKPIKTAGKADTYRLERYILKLTNHAHKEGSCKPFHSRTRQKIPLLEGDNVFLDESIQENHNIYLPILT